MITAFKLYENKLNKGLILTSDDLGVDSIEDLPLDSIYDDIEVLEEYQDPYQGGEIYRICLTRDYNFIVTYDWDIIDLKDRIIEIKDEMSDSDDKKIYREILQLLKDLKKDLSIYIKQVKNGTFEIVRAAKNFNI